MVGGLLPYLNSDGLEFVEENFEDFIQAVEHKAKKTDATWTEILKYFYFIPEINAITDYLEGDKSLAEEYIQEVQVAL